MSAQRRKHSNSRAAPSVCGLLEAKTKGATVRVFVAMLRPLVEQMAMLTATIEKAVEVHPDTRVERMHSHLRYRGTRPRVQQKCSRPSPRSHRR